jgi:GNAT superfamily N-acetyltransferase
VRATGVTADQLVVRRATQADVSIVLQMIRALAEYEKLSEHVVATETMLDRSLFGSDPAAEVLLAFLDNRPVGFAVYFRSFSTFLGGPAMYLEDIFVAPESRGRGIGRQLLATVAKIAVERGCGRMDWSVLDWNAPAIEFYRRLGARPLDDWTIYRLIGKSLADVAALAGDTDGTAG